MQSAIQIDTFKESVNSVGDAAKHVAKLTGKKSNRNLILRWANRGVSGVVLATIRIGGEIYTSREALNAFMNESRHANKSKHSARTSAGIKQVRLAEVQEDVSAEEQGI